MSARLYKEFAYKTPKCDFPLSSGVFPITVPPFREPTVTAWRGTTLGRDITNAISLIMPLRLRGSYATERHAFSYNRQVRRSICSPPCGSCSVFEVAQSVYKCIKKLKEKLFREILIISCQIDEEQGNALWVATLMY